jgi:uncharacterized protein involved in exopolysaccharide biosynthesis
MNENVRLLRPFFRGLPIIVTVMILSVLVAQKYLSYVTPMYESTVKLKLADVQEGVPSANLFKDLDVFASANKIATEIEVLKSSALIEKTLNELPFEKEIYRKGDVQSVELFNNAPILIEANFSAQKAYNKRYVISILSASEYLFSYPNKKNSLKGRLGKPLKINGGEITVSLNDSFIKSRKEIKIIDNYEFEFLGKQKLMDKINKNLDIVSVDKDVPVIRINLKSNVPEKAALFVNKLAEVYIKDYIENKYRAANTTVDFLKQEINGANDKLAASESNIQHYRDNKNIINIRQETETDLRKLSELKIQQTNIKMNLDAIKDLNQYIKSGQEDYLSLAPNFEAFTDLLSTEMVKNMKKLQSDKKDLLLTYTPENEKVKIIDEKLKDLVNYQIESIKNTERNLQIKYNELSSDIEESEQKFTGLPEKERVLHTLDREFNLYEKNYNFLNEKRIEAEIAKSAKIAFHKIITPAEISKTPVSPIRGIIIIVAAFLGLLGSITIVYIVHFAKAKVNDAYTIEKNSTIPIAIATPFIKDKKSIRDNFLKEVVEMDLKGIIPNQGLLVLSSYDKDKDHLFHSIHLLAALKAQGRKVLLIDAVGEQSFEGLGADCINVSDPKYLSVTKADFISAIKTKMNNYDFCFVHNQAIKNKGLALLFMSIASQNLMLVDSRKTAEKTIVKIELLKDEYQLPSFWFVLNKAKYSPSVFLELKTIFKKVIKIKFAK